MIVTKHWLTTIFALSLGLLAAGSIPTFTDEGFRVPQPGTELSFPRAHASHPDYKIEWWYLTGHLFAADGRRFGYQATFFRSALKPPAEQHESAFGSSHLYLTHMALTDPDEKSFYFDQRLSRDGWDAYARTDRLATRNGPWTLEMVDTKTGRMHLSGSVASDVTWELSLSPAKPLVRFGPDGTSRKGPAPEARSYYLSFTRLKAEGTVRIGEHSWAVSGSSWMDHEIASNQLDPSLVGWDWIAIQLEDGWELKAYLLRQEDGTPSPFSALIWISPEGRLHYRDPDAFTWSSSRSWQSPHTDAVYPIAPVIETVHPVSKAEVTFAFLPVLEDQELVLPGTTYWEGAGAVANEAGEHVGQAYLELVGYAGAIEGLR